MRILSFEIQDADGWTLEPMKLDAFNLLVGISGAGKTRIVRALARVCAVAMGTETETDSQDARGTKFKIAFEHEQHSYSWEAEFDDKSAFMHEDSFVRAPPIHAERIERDGQPFVKRTADDFEFNGQPIPKLDRATSAIAILKEEPAMVPLHQAFSRCVLHALGSMPMSGIQSVASFEKLRQQYGSVEALGADFSQPLHNKAELLQELFPTGFDEISEAFRDAFPLVEKIRVQRYYRTDQPFSLTEARYHVALGAEESGVTRGIPFSAMSSGMQRYLSFLVHLSFAPRGTVVLIDELESSFGINCLPAATRFLLRRAPELQLILTSHHPYIIQQIPIACWKLVTRKGSRVRVLDAAQIPALAESRSHLDRFTRLTNLPEYEQGIHA